MRPGFVFVEGLAVIGDHHDDRVVESPGLLELEDQAAEEMVPECDAAVVHVDQFLACARVEGRARERARQAGLEACEVAAKWPVDGLLAKSVAKRDRWVIGPVRLHVVNVREPRSTVRQLLEPGRELAVQESCAQALDPVARLVRAKAGSVGACVLLLTRSIRFPVRVVEHLLIALGEAEGPRDVRVVGEECRAVAGSAEGLGQRHDALGQTRLARLDAVLRRAQPSEQRRHRGLRPRRRCPCVVEDQSAAGEGVEVPGRRALVTVERQVIGAQCVDDQQQHVGRIGHGRARQRQQRAEPRTAGDGGASGQHPAAPSLCLSRLHRR